MNAMQRMIKNSTDQAIVAVKKRYTGKQAPVNIAKDIKTIMSLMNTEAKHIDTLATIQTVKTITSLVYGIGTVAQGNADNQRSGDSIKIIKIDLNLQFTISTGTVTTAAENNQIFNWYLIRYLKTPSSSGTTAFGIQDFINTDSGGNYTPMSFPNTDTNQNFHVIDSGQVNLVLDIIGVTGAAAIEKTAIVTVSDDVSFHQDYSGSAATTITENMCFLVFTALNNVNSSGVSGVTVSARMWYVDN